MVTRVKGGTAPNASEIDMEDGRTVPEAIGGVQTNLDIHASLTSLILMGWTGLPEAG